MHHELIGPSFGNFVIIVFAGIITLGCFIAMFWMLMRPGEKDRRHCKYTILRDDH